MSKAHVDDGSSVPNRQSCWVHPWIFIDPPMDDGRCQHPHLDQVNSSMFLGTFIWKNVEESQPHHMILFSFRTKHVLIPIVGPAVLSHVKLWLLNCSTGRFVKAEKCLRLSGGNRRRSIRNRACRRANQFLQFRTLAISRILLGLT